MAPFPPEALQQYKKKGPSLTSVKASYLMERLHNVFGHGNVEVGTDLVEVSSLGDKPYVQWLGELRIWGSDGELRFSFDLVGLRELDAFLDWEDTLKSARTNAISKACYENLLLGIDVFKGKGQQAAKNAPLTPEQESKRKRAKQQAEMEAWGRKNAEAFKGMIASVTTPGTRLKEMPNDEIDSLYSIFKKEA